MSNTALGTFQRVFDKLVLERLYFVTQRAPGHEFPPVRHCQVLAHLLKRDERGFPRSIKIFIVFG